MRVTSLVSLLVASLTAMSVAHADLISAAEDRRLCAAAVSDAALEVVVDQLMDAGQFSYDMAPNLLTLNCGGVSLIQAMINNRQGENLEFAVIDLGVDVDYPLIPVEAGKLSVVQYLMQQAVMAPDDAARRFSMEYMEDLASGEFNPNIQLVRLK
jgi:hypothetical protein